MRKTIQIIAILFVFVCAVNILQAQSWRDDAVEVKTYEVLADGKEQECTVFETGKNVGINFYAKYESKWKAKDIFYSIKNIDTGEEDKYGANFDSPRMFDIQTIHKGKWQIRIFDMNTKEELGVSPIFTVKL